MKKQPIDKLEANTFRRLKPPPKLTVSGWADKYRQLSSKASAEPGRWRTSRAEYQRGMMDAVNDPAINSVVIMSSAQIGKTEIIGNIVGFHIHQDPSPILVLQPTIQMAETWSQDRLAEMIRYTTPLKDLIADPKSRDGDNKVLHKSFPGGHVTMTGANSPASLASRPIRIVLCDEVDRYPVSAGSEGDPLNLARKRTTNFWNRKIIMTSTPTIKNASRIETAYESSDKRRFFVPCPHCGGYQTLKWGGKDEVFGIKWEGHAEDVGYMCEFCGVIIRNRDKPRMLSQGEWRQTGTPGKVAGFHLNELYSPWVGWDEIVENFLEDKKSPETLQTWVNTTLGETFEEQGEGLESHKLQERQEPYSPDDILPEGVLVITAGADVQDDRIEVEFVGWGLGEESWSLDYVILNGDPSDRAVWERFTDEIERVFNTKYGSMKATFTFVDSGYMTDVVYNYCRGRQGVYAIQGQASSTGTPKPIVPEKQKRSKKGLYVPVGVDVAKDVIYSRLRFTKPGPGYCHFPEHYSEEYFKQLTAEDKRTKWVQNRPVKYWFLAKGKRNEALDCRAYAFAALRFRRVRFETLKRRLERRIKPQELKEEESLPRETPTTRRPRKSRPSRPRKIGFVHSWKF